MSTDLEKALRKRKPDKHVAQLVARPLDALPAWTTLVGSEPVVLLPDTTVYIHEAGGKLPDALRELIERALLFHCSVALAELAMGVANADPTHPQWPALRNHYTRLFEGVPEARLLTPDEQIWTEAGLVAGTLARTQGFQPHQRRQCLNDALLLLTAAKAGLPVLTANRGEFDLIQQLVPEGRFIHY